MDGSVNFDGSPWVIYKAQNQERNAGLEAFRQMDEVLTFHVIEKPCYANTVQKRHHYLPRGTKRGQIPVCTPIRDLNVIDIGQILRA